MALEAESQGYRHLTEGFARALEVESQGYKHILNTTVR